MTKNVFNTPDEDDLGIFDIVGPNSFESLSYEPFFSRVGAVTRGSSRRNVPSYSSVSDNWGDDYPDVYATINNRESREDTSVATIDRYRFRTIPEITIRNSAMLKAINNKPQVIDLDEDDEECI